MLVVKPENFFSMDAMNKIIDKLVLDRDIVVYFAYLTGIRL